MSTTLRLTLIGMYDEYDKLFDLLELPEGIDKTEFIDSLLFAHGEKGVMYSNPLFMARMVSVWGTKHYHDFERIYMALTEDYDPLYNFDRHEEYTDTLTGGKSTLHDFTSSGSDNETYTRTSDTTLSHERDTDTETEEKTSAFNSSTYEPSKKNIESGGNFTDTTSGGDYTDNHTLSGRDAGSESVKENNKNVHEGHLFGNIGITESTAMLKNELNTRMKFNLYDILGKMFAGEFLINIW